MSTFGRAAEWLRAKLGDFAPTTSPPSVKAPAHADELVASVPTDWTSAVRVLLDATAPLLRKPPTEASMDAIAIAISTRAVRCGIDALSWVHGHPAANLVRGHGGRSSRERGRVLKSIELGSGERLPSELEGAAAAFLASARTRTKRETIPAHTLSPENRARAIVAAYMAWLRLLLDGVDQLAAAATVSGAAQELLEGARHALSVGGVSPLATAVAAPPDLASARIVAYDEAPVPGHVLAVTREGMAYRGEVLRKAEVTVGTRQKTTEQQE